MAEQIDPTNNDDVDLPPSAEGIAAPRREKKKKGFKVTQGKIYMGALAVMVLVAGYALIGGGGEAPTPAGPAPTSGGAAVETELDEYMRFGSDDGGVGQERAEVLAEIDEREELERRILSGQSAVRFGEAYAEEEEEEVAPPPAPNVFGSVTPREPPPMVTPDRRSPEVLPLSGNTVHHGAPSQGSGPDMNRIAYELQLAQGAVTTHTGINHHQVAANNGGIRALPHPLTPELSRDGSLRTQQASSAPEKLALPGDLVVAYMSNRISSDQPSGRVRIDILEGDLKGGRMLGEAAFEGERLIINFNQLVFEGEVFDDVHAVAVDPSTLDASVQDGINRRLFVRYGVPILAGIAGLGIDYEAHRRNPSVTETNWSTGETISRRTNESDRFTEYALTEAADGFKVPLEAIATRAANTPAEVWAQPGVIGLMFITAVER